MDAKTTSPGYMFKDWLRLAFQEDSFIYPGDVSVIGDFQLENPDRLKVVNDVQNLLMIGIFIVSWLLFLINTFHFMRI